MNNIYIKEPIGYLYLIFELLHLGRHALRWQESEGESESSTKAMDAILKECLSKYEDRTLGGGKDANLTKMLILMP